MAEPSSTKRHILDIDKRNVQRLLINKSDRIKTVELDTKKPKFHCFKRIKVDDSDTLFVTCGQCNDQRVLQYDTSKGSNGLSYHATTHGNKSSQESIETHVTKPCSREDKGKVTKAAAKMCALDMRPFVTIEGQGMEILIETIIDVISRKGKIAAKTLLPCADTIKSEMMNLSSELKSKLKESLLNQSYINATSDHWHDTTSNQDYMTVTIHYYHVATSTLNSRVIGTFAVDSKTSVATESGFKDKLNEFGIKDKIRIVVTDNASSMKKAFQEYEWIGCAAHNLSLVQKWSFNQQSPKEEPDPIPTITTQLECVKDLVTFVKKSSLNSQLETRLRQAVETRWDSTYDMIRSVLDNFDSLSEQSSLTKYMDTIKKGFLREICDILKIFKDIRVTLSSEDQPTLHAVFLSYVKLVEHIDAIKSSHNGIIVLRSRMKRFLNLKFNVTPIHVIATFLYPKYRSIQCSNNKLKEESTEKLKQLIEEVAESDDEENIKVPYYDTMSESVFNIFDDLTEKRCESSDAMNEVDEYKRIKLSDVDRSSESCPFEFWVQHRDICPKLSHLALWLLSAPATSCSSERNFSSAGFVVDHRNRLLPDTVDNLLLLKSNSDIVKWL